MSTIAEAAAAALAEKKAAEAELAAQMRDALVGVVRATVSQTLAPLDAADLEVVHVDLDADLVVLTDGTVSLAGYDRGDIYLVRNQAGWSKASGRLTSLADLGAALAAQAGA